MVFEITVLSMQRNKVNVFDICDIEQICKFRRVLVKNGCLIRLKVSSRCLLPSPIVFNSKKSHLWRHCDVIFFEKLVFEFRKTKPPYSLMFQKLFEKTYFMKNRSRINISCNDVIICRWWRHRLSLMTSYFFRVIPRIPPEFAEFAEKLPTFFRTVVHILTRYLC